VVCNDQAEVEELTQMLQGESILCMACHEETSSEALDIIRVWNENSSDKNLMICSDRIFHELAVDSAQNIIHFSLPEKWSTFCYRFSALFGYIQDLTSAEVRHNV
jgi:superfamily II DNA/RNA helicase